MTRPVAAALAAAPVPLDGGLGTLLEAHGHDLSSHLWSARLLIERPEAVVAAHAEYFRAGARVAITSSYQVGYDVLEREGLDADAVDVLLTRSVQLAAAARDEAGVRDSAWIAASVGPYGATRADGSEYTGDYDLGLAELREWHRRRLRVLDAAGADLLAVETIPSLTEVAAIVAELEGARTPAWVSVTIADGALRSGESLAEAFALAAASDAVLAVGVNCCDPREVTDAIRTAREVTSKPIVVYPNSGELWDAAGRVWRGDLGIRDDLVAEWLDAGAGLVGGCCRIGSTEVARVARAVAQRDD